MAQHGVSALGVCGHGRGQWFAESMCNTCGITDATKFVAVGDCGTERGDDETRDIGVV